MTEYQKMHNGMIYDTQDAELVQVQKHSHRLCEQDSIYRKARRE